MTSGTCNLTMAQVQKLRSELQAFVGADDRNFNDKERVLQLAEELANALIVKLLEIEQMTSASKGSDAQEAILPAGQPDRNDQNLLEALEGYNEVNRLRMQATQRDADLAALKHFRPKE